MPGAYAHLTIVGLLSSSNELDSVENFPVAAKISILDNTNFCDLGAVSPDYPYLQILDANACLWADLMHHQSIDKMIISGVEAIRMLDDNRRPKVFAWFLGFVSHIVADMTVHPVVELKVGQYEQNKSHHRKCEMHQDSYIFPRINVGNVGASEYLDSGIATCSETGGSMRLNKAVRSTWEYMLRECYPDQYRSNAPKINNWHKYFLTTVDAAEEGSQLFAIARHVAVETGLTYPRYNKIDAQYISGLETPEGAMHYDEIFGRAQKNTLRMWALLASAVYENSEAYKEFIGDWSLDTGRDSNNNLVYWR
jgi:hypothetical protein